MKKPRKAENQASHDWGNSPDAYLMWVITPADNPRRSFDESGDSMRAAAVLISHAQSADCLVDRKRGLCKAGNVSASTARLAGLDVCI
jgi:hypothetical protein